MKFDFRNSFETALPYADFLSKHALPKDQDRWARVVNAVSLTDAQRQLLDSFRRRMPVLVMAGAWCGDCVKQCPILQHFADATPLIELRFVDRDANRDLADNLMLMGSPRVPQAVFFNEDLLFVARYGDRTLSQYRDLNERLSGAACATGIVAPNDPAQAKIVDEWLGEFERVQWLLRTSPSLRERHGD